MEPSPSPNDKETSTTPIYRDGLGRPIVNEDELIRKKLFDQLSKRFSRRVTCANQGRGGTVVYVDGERRLEFWHEIGGDDCKWFIQVPTSECWESSTGVSLSEREEILNFIATEIQRDQCPNWNYCIGSNSISFHASVAN